MHSCWELLSWFVMGLAEGRLSRGSALSQHIKGFPKNQWFPSGVAGPLTGAPEIALGAQSFVSREGIKNRISAYHIYKLSMTHPIG